MVARIFSGTISLLMVPTAGQYIPTQNSKIKKLKKHACTENDFARLTATATTSKDPMARPKLGIKA